MIACLVLATDADAKRKRSSQAKRAFKKENPCPSTGFSKGSCPGYHIDHVIPLHNGGTDTPENMQWMTEAEHRDKHGKTRIKTPPLAEYPAEAK